MILKHDHDIDWQDLPNIEDPFFARLPIQQAFFDHFGPSRIWGIDKILRDKSYGNRAPSRDQQSLEQLLELVGNGKVFLVHDLGSKPFSPVVRLKGDGESKEPRQWVVTMSNSNLFARSNLESVIQSLLITGGGGRRPAESSWLDEALGGAKEIVNEVGRRTAASLAESMGAHFVETSTGREVDLSREGKDLLPPANAAQQQGAQAVRDNRSTAAIVSMIMALSSKFRSVVRHPDEFTADLKKALTYSRSEAEALGKAGLEQAKRRLGHKTDNRYVDRYHGPDDITRKEGKLAEWEAKGNRKDSKAVATNSNGERQSSRLKNKRRARLMTEDKAKKINLPSNRQGGSYTREEIDLWEEIKANKGRKQHISVHTNTETGRVRVYERDQDGDIDTTLDEFKMENFNAIKQAIGEAFKQ